MVGRGTGPIENGVTIESAISGRAWRHDDSLLDSPAVNALVVNFVQLLATALWVLVLGRVIVSWVDPRGSNQLSMFLIQATEPFLAPIRRLLPQSPMLDLSPLILMLVLGVILRAVTV